MSSLARHRLWQKGGPYAATGGSSSISANRISYSLGLKGPSATRQRQRRAKKWMDGWNVGVSHRGIPKFWGGLCDGKSL